MTQASVDLDAAELYICQQLQCVGGKLLLREVKTEASEAPLPLPALGATALRIRKRQQDAVHPRVAMRILRHSKIAVTMEVYTEAPSEATCEALHRLSVLLVA
jgi:hypothetical protein